MSFYNIGDLKRDVNRKTHGVGATQCADFFGSADEGRREMIGKVRPPELTRKVFIEQALYDQVDKYAVPEDLKYEDVIEIKKLSSRRNVDSLEHPLEIVYRRQFDQKRRGAKNVMAIARENGIKYAKIFNPRGLQDCSHQLINGCEYLTGVNPDGTDNGNGTWNVSGNVGNLQLDRLNHITGKASLRFDIDNSSTTGSIYNFTMRPVNITDYLQLGAVFAWLDIPIPKEMTSVKITLGSDPLNLATDIYEFTVNQPFDNNQFITGWNLLRFSLDNLTSVGNPNPREIVYVRLDFTTTGQAIPACHLDNVVARKGVVYELTYNSTYMFQDLTSGAWKKTPTLDTDLIVAEEDTYQIFMLETALSVQKEIYANGTGSQADVTAIDQELNGQVPRTGRGIRGGKYQTYLIEHKSEAIPAINSTYIFGEMYSGLMADPENQMQGDWGSTDDDSPQSGGGN